MRIVLDTNVIISGVFWKGPPNEVLKLIETGNDIDFAQSIDTFNEVEEVIKRGKFAEIIKKREMEVNSILESLLTLCKFYRIPDQVKENVGKSLTIEDPDDIKFVELAVAAEAEFIVSGDPHLLKIKKYRDISIVKPAEFLDIIGRGF